MRRDRITMREGLTVVSYSPQVLSLEDWMRWAVKAEVATWEGRSPEEASDLHAEARFYRERGLAVPVRFRPVRVSRFGYRYLRDGLLVNAGGNFLMKRLSDDSVADSFDGRTVTGSPSTANAVEFNNALTRIGVGNGTTAASTGQTDLVGASTLRKAMDAAFPKIKGESFTDFTGATVSVADRAWVVRSTFGTGEANFAWEEHGIFNSASGATMLDRFLSAEGTKTVNQTREETITVTAS